MGLMVPQDRQLGHCHMRVEPLKPQVATHWNQKLTWFVLLACAVSGFLSRGIAGGFESGFSGTSLLHFDIFNSVFFLLF